MSWSQGGTLSLGQVQKWIDDLEDAGLVEQIPPEGGEQGQPPTYRATAEGVRRYEEWLSTQVKE